MHAPRLLIITLVAGCGSQRVQGYLDDLADCPSSTTASTTGTTDPADTTTSSTTGTTEPDTTAEPDTTSATTAPPDTDPSSTTDSSTGDPPSICGDGVLDELGPAPEECDDGNLDPGDGCSKTCTLDIRVFVSSLQYTAGELEGVHLADASCANLAAQTGDPTFIKYRAWLSDSTTDARDHIKVGRGRIVLVNGLVVAESWDALLAGELQSPIEVTEKSETYHGSVWTGTRPDGTAAPGSTHCADWTSDSLQTTGYFGESNKTTAEWTLSESFINPDVCASYNSIYCFKTR